MLEWSYPLNPNIAMQKRFVNRKPETTAVLTDEGRAAIETSSRARSRSRRQSGARSGSSGWSPRVGAQQLPRVRPGLATPCRLPIMLLLKLSERTLRCLRRSPTGRERVLFGQFPLLYYRVGPRRRLVKSRASPQLFAHQGKREPRPRRIGGWRSVLASPAVGHCAAPSRPHTTAACAAPQSCGTVPR